MTVQKAIEKIKWTMQSKSHNKEFCEYCIQALKELEQYRALGTVEELKEAREKQVAKKVIKIKTETQKYYRCPSCQNITIRDYCGVCGQKIDWSEEDD